MSNNISLPDKLTVFLKRIKEKTILGLLFLISIYGFFVFGVESTGIKTLVRIFIVCLFLLLIYFRYRKGAVSQEIDKDTGLDKKVESDFEVIKKLAGKLQIKSKDESEADLESYINKILYVVCSTFVASSAVLYLIDHDKNMLIPKGIALHNEEECLVKELSLNEEVVREILEKKEIIIKHELTKEELNNICESKSLILKSSLSAPVVIENETVGILSVLSNTKSAFGEEDKSLIKSFSEIIEKTIINYNNIFEFENSSLLFSSFYEINKLLNPNLKFEEIIDTLIIIIKKIFEFDRVSVSLVAEEGGHAEIKRVEGQIDEYGVGYEFSLDDGLNGWVIRKNKPITISNLEKGDYFRPRYSKNEKSNFGLKSFLSAPIGYYDKCLGAVTLESRGKNLYREHHENILSILTNNVGAALERSIIYQKLESEATTDELTRLNNYRAFILRLYDEINRSERYKLKFCLFMMDIDRFKMFNDRYGHLVGDQVLKAIGKSIKSSLRNIDFVARYGGEEFVAIIIETDISDAKISAERIRKTIENTKYKFNSSEYQITISIGVAEYPESAKTEEELINKADQALYQAKAAGRNKVVYYEES